MRLVKGVGKLLGALLLLRLLWVLFTTGTGTAVLGVLVYGLLAWVVWRALPACRADVAAVRRWFSRSLDRDKEGVRF